MNLPDDKTDATWKFTAANEAETEALGKMLAEVLPAGLVVALTGDLGAGKTRLVQAVAAAMGVDRDQVNSPTFVLIQEYEGRMPLYHFDAYRLRDTDEFLELGAEEIMESSGICFIEWADRVADVLPADLLTIDIEVSGPTSRCFRFRGNGEKSIETVRRLRFVK